MQIVVSLAVILAALSVAVAGSAETEPTLSKKFEQFQQDVQTFFDHVGEKAKTAFHDLQYSTFSNKTRDWITDNIQKLKAKWKDAFPTQGTD